MSVTRAPTGMRSDHGAATDPGVRGENQDAFFLSSDAESEHRFFAVLAVADGMGGHAHGRAAAELALSAVSEIGPANATVEGILRAALEANRRVVDRARAVGETVGTTLTLAVARAGSALIAHVGDSRAYLIHEGTVAQITADHSFTGEMTRRGHMTPTEAARHPQRNVLHRALGPSEDVEVDIYEAGISPGDIIVLATDGLVTVGLDDLLAVVEGGASLHEAASDLVALARARDGSDNMTVVLWRHPGATVNDSTATAAPRAADSSPVPVAASALAAFVAGIATGMVIRALS